MKWNLCADVFTFWDKVKISKFLFTERIWTYGKYVAKYEKMWEDFIGHGTHAIMVSSGSTANELIALRRKWELEKAGKWPKKNKVVVPVNTWISSVTPWIHAGFDIIFTDVDQANLNMMSYHLEEVFKKDTNKEIGTVFYTALLGFFGDLEKCKDITEKHGAVFLMDNCEASFSGVAINLGIEKRLVPIMSFATCSTSIFYSHFTTSGTEGGLIVTKSEEEADWYRMMKSHGLTRGMPEKYKNSNVHPSFDFALLGSNYRSSNLQAYMASLDFKRAVDYSFEHRYAVHYTFQLKKNHKKFKDFYQPNECEGSVIPLALPIICESRDLRVKVETYCKINGIETRPIIGGVLLAHTAFKKYGNPKDFPVANNAHECGLYLGINQNVTLDMVKELASALNKL